MKKQQILVIQGGNVFNSYEDYLEELNNKEMTLERIKLVTWRKNLQNDLDEDFDVLIPSMPRYDNAKYAEWKIRFEKIIPLLDDNFIVVATSLGALFVVKYLSENHSPKKIFATFLVAAPFALETKYALGDFRIKGDLQKLEEQGGKLFFYQSKDDKIVLPSEVEEYRKRLPSAVIRLLDGYGHFEVEKFPEIIEDIKSI